MWDLVLSVNPEFIHSAGITMVGQVMSKTSVLKDIIYLFDEYTVVADILVEVPLRVDESMTIRVNPESMLPSGISMVRWEQVAANLMTVAFASSSINLRIV